MPKIEYVHKKFRSDTLRIIEQANEIIEAYLVQGYDLTLRQLYYQFVAKDLIPNTERSYKRLGSIINDARLAGLIDWDVIEDRSRHLMSLPSWRTPASTIKSAARAFRHDLWKNQDYRVEVWVEKEALAGVIGRICNTLRVDYFACKGYTSQSAQWRAARRLLGHMDSGQTPIVLHLGDHDPSGIDMTRDITDRFDVFMATTKVERLALNMDQVEEFDPPPNPAKTTDSRYAGYIKLYGHESWELDALEPRVISDLIEKATLKFRDQELWESDLSYEEADRERLEKASDNWTEVSEFLNDY